MAECPYSHICAFIADQSPKFSSFIGLYQGKYCQGDFEACTRYIVQQKLQSPKESGESLPDNEEKIKIVFTNN